MNHDDKNRFEPLSSIDSEFLKHVRGTAIFMVVLSHIGAMWMWLPYSSFISTLAPIFFFASGAGNFYSHSASKRTHQYYYRRLVGLFVPYYLFCIAALLFFVVQQGRLPGFDLASAVSWLIIKPSNRITPFPVAQLWFLRTLVIVVFVSPLLFFSLKKGRTASMLGAALVLVVSAFQTRGLESPLIRLIGLDFYRALFYSVFFVAGAAYYSNKSALPKGTLWLTLFFSLVVSVVLTAGFHQQVSLTYHVEVTDLYFAAASSGVLFLLLILRDPLLFLAGRVPGIPAFLRFLNKQSLSILLLHTLAIYLIENSFGGALSEGSGLKYAVVKALGTLAVTFVLCVPFTLASDWISSRLLARSAPKKKAVPA